MDILVIIVKVILPLPIRQYFTYFMPDSMLPIIGGRIIVPFRSKKVVGIVVAFFKINNISKLNCKFVVSIIDTKPICTNILLDIIIWLSKNYHFPIGYLFFSILPKFFCDGKIIKNSLIQQWTITKKGQETNSRELKITKKQSNALFFLKKNSLLSSELKKYNVSKNILYKLEIKQLCQVNFVDKNIFEKNSVFKVSKKIFINKKIMFAIKTILSKKNFSSFLLTKTCLFSKIKFYLGIIQEILKKDLQILILVSSIKDINKILYFLKKYFDVFIDIIHSNMTNNVYFKTWMRTKNGENSIVIGTKKSIFLPFLKLGLIIIDQEHSLNYKNTGKMRYNVRDISILRAYKENIPIILDSETPSLKTLHNILSKKCFYIKIDQCDNIFHLKNNIIDLKKERTKIGLSETLIYEINKNLKKENQVLLIFNKFNCSFFVLMCNVCKWIVTCSNCNEYYEINQYQNILFCKFCLITIKKPLFCYKCKSLSLTIFNLDIENIKNQIQKIFPKTQLIFLLNQKNISKNILNIKFFEFSTSSSLIIFTTENIVQNYYFPHVKLIGLVGIDHYFLSYKFRSIEYFAQFYINLKKLIKSTVKSFKILIQTSCPYDVYLQEICQNGYFSLADKILSLRKKFFLPPWSAQGIFYSESFSSEKNFIFLNFLRKIIKKKSKKYNNFIWCVGPNPCFLLNNKKKYSYQLLIQCSSRLYLHNVLNESIDIIKLFSISKKVVWFLDIDPN